jgi:hypothetical protein
MKFDKSWNVVIDSCKKSMMVGTDNSIFGKVGKGETH